MHGFLPKATIISLIHYHCVLVFPLDEMDMTKLSPHQSKRMELELQAELLRQESDLEKSRRKLATLRQHHYHNSDG